MWREKHDEAGEEGKKERGREKKNPEIVLKSSGDELTFDSFHWPIRSSSPVLQQCSSCYLVSLFLGSSWINHQWVYSWPLPKRIQTGPACRVQLNSWSTLNILKASYGSNTFWGFWISVLCNLFCKLDSVLHSHCQYRTRSLCYLEVFVAQKDSSEYHAVGAWSESRAPGRYRRQGCLVWACE